MLGDHPMFVGCLSWDWLVTVLIPCYGGLPSWGGGLLSWGWLVTVLCMVGDHPEVRYLGFWGLCVTILD